MTEIHQVLVGAGRTDAITNMARALREALRTLGESEIYARHPAPGIDDVLPLDQFPREDSAGRTIVFHASGGDPDVFELLNSVAEQIVLVFHNIAPAELFDDVDPSRAEMLRLGWQELELLRPKVSLAIADSVHNAKCLADVGYEDVKVIAAGVDAYRLHRLTPDPAMWHRLGHEVHGPLLMYVGQSVPHKRPEVLVQMQYLLTRHVGRFPSLAMVGPPTVPVVNAAALEQARVLRVPGCLFYGQLTDAELAAVYRRADLFVTASMHEGLCIPILEAMAAGVPVVGRAVGALPDTVGDAGLLLPVDAGPEMFAEAVGELLDDQGLRSRMAFRGRQRLRDFDEDAATTAFREALAGVM